MGDDSIRRACTIFALEEMRRLLQDPPDPPEAYSTTRQPRREQGETDAAYIHKLLTETETSCQVQLRLDRHMFAKLVSLMTERGLLPDEKYVKVTEQVAICLFILAKDKYYLADSVYLNTLGSMCPFTGDGVRVHTMELKDVPPRGYKEHFNKLHSSLRTKVECSFGQLKRRWRVLYNMPQTSKKGQMSIIVAMFTRHNFIWMHSLGIPVRQHDRNVEEVADSDIFENYRKNSMAKVREAIVKKTWRTYRFDSDNEDDSILPAS